MSNYKKCELCNTSFGKRKIYEHYDECVKYKYCSIISGFTIRLFIQTPSNLNVLYASIGFETTLNDLDNFIKNV